MLEQINLKIVKLTMFFACLILATTVIFSLLHFLQTGSLLPILTNRQSQHFPQEVLYWELHDFEQIDITHIRSTSNSSWILIRTNPDKEGSILHINISNPSEPSILARILYRSADEHFNDYEPLNFCHSNSIYIWMENGDNVITLPDTNIAAFRLHLAVRPNIHMSVNEVILRNYIPLPGHFWTLFVVLLLSCGVILYLLFFKAAHLKGINEFFIRKLPQLLSKKKTTFAVLALPVAFTMAYCVLSLVISGSVGVPRFMQRDISFSQDAVYDNFLHGFDVEGEVIWANNDSAYIKVELEEIIWGRYRYATLFISRLSDPDRNIALRAFDSDQTYATYFQLLEGQNTVRFQRNDWDGVEITLGTRQNMSMIIDEISFSRFPVLPDYFVILFAALAVLIGITWYLTVFRGFGKWLLVNPWMLFVIMVFFQVLFMSYYVAQKASFHIDEMITISQSVSLETGEYGVYFTDRPDFHDTWHSPEYFWNAITVQGNERFDFISLHNWIRTTGHTQPLQHLNYLLVASFFPDTFNLLIVGIITIFWMILTNIFLFKASLLVIKNPLLALLPVAIWGFSNAAMSLATYIRFYNQSTFFFTLTTYLGLLLITGKTKAGLKYCLALGVTFFLGWLTAMQFILFFGIAAVLLLLWLLHGKELRQIRNCAITLAISTIAHHLFYNVNLGRRVAEGRLQNVDIGEILTGGRLENIARFAGRQEERWGYRGIDYHLERLDGFLSHLDSTLFGDNMYSVIILLIVLSAIALARISGFNSDAINNFHVRDKLLQILFTGLCVSLIVLFTHISKEFVGVGITLLTVLLFMLLVIVFIAYQKHKSIFEQCLKSNGYALAFMMLGAAVFFIVASRLAFFVSTRYMISIQPTIALIFVLLIYLVMRTTKKNIMYAAVIFMAAFVIVSNMSNRDSTLLYRESQQHHPPNTAAIFSTEESLDTLIAINSFGANTLNHMMRPWLLYDAAIFERTYIVGDIPEDFEHEGFRYALDSIEYGEGLYVLVSGHIDSDLIFDHMQQNLGFSDVVLLYRKYLFSMYRIMW